MRKRNTLSSMDGQYGPGAIDLARIHGRTMEVGPDDIVGSRGGLSDVAINLRRSDFTRQERKRPRWHVAGWRSSRPSDLCPIETRRRAVFNRSSEAQALKGIGQTYGRRLMHPSGRDLGLSDVDEPRKTYPWSPPPLGRECIFRSQNNACQLTFGEKLRSSTDPSTIVRLSSSSKRFHSPRYKARSACPWPRTAGPLD